MEEKDGEMSRWERFTAEGPGHRHREKWRTGRLVSVRETRGIEVSLFPTLTGPHWPNHIPFFFFFFFFFFSFFLGQNPYFTLH